MEKVSYIKRNCTDQTKIDSFLSETRIGILGLSDTSYPYAVPVNFIWHNNSIYFHGMGSGKKVNLLEKTSGVCFTVYQEYGTAVDPMPCHADTAYISVMIFGDAHKIIDCAEGANILNILVNKYMPGYYGEKPINEKLIEKYRSALDKNAVAVYCIKPEHLTAKQNVVDSDELFIIE